MIDFSIQRNSRFYLLMVLVCVSIFTMASTAHARQGLLLQVSDGDPKKWNLALNIAKNAPQNSTEPLDVVIIAFGPGLKMLMKDSQVANRLKQATTNGVEFRACGMTMNKLRVKESDLYSSQQVKRVKGGVLEIMRLQSAGYTYVKP